MLVHHCTSSLSPLVPSVSPKRLWALMNYTYLAHRDVPLPPPLFCPSLPVALEGLPSPAGEELWEALYLSARGGWQADSPAQPRPDFGIGSNCWYRLKRQPALESEPPNLKMSTKFSFPGHFSSYWEHTGKMVENKTQHCEENMDSESNKLYSNSKLFPMSVLDLNCLLILILLEFHFNMRESPLAFPTMVAFPHKRAYETPRTS